MYVCALVLLQHVHLVGYAGKMTLMLSVFCKKIVIGYLQHSNLRLQNVFDDVFVCVFVQLCMWVCAVIRMHQLAPRFIHATAYIQQGSGPSTRTLKNEVADMEKAMAAILESHSGVSKAAEEAKVVCMCMCLRECVHVCRHS
jgi:hypothetical protein